VREFNLRLREQFDAFVVDSDASAVPIWKLAIPDPLARHLADTLDAPDVAAYIERRVTELGLRDDARSDTSRNYPSVSTYSAQGRARAAGSDRRAGSATVLLNARISRRWDKPWRVRCGTRRILLRPSGEQFVSASAST
jgi:hypothetical protein